MDLKAVLAVLVFCTLYWIYHYSAGAIVWEIAERYNAMDFKAILELPVFAILCYRYHFSSGAVAWKYKEDLWNTKKTYERLYKNIIR